MWKFSSDMPLSIRYKAMGEKIDFVIPSGKDFSVWGMDLYTLKTKPITLAKEDIRSQSCDGEGHKEGDVVYPVFYAGEGFVAVWKNGKIFFCMQPSHLEADSFQAQPWIHIYFNGRHGWWGEPAHCYGSGWKKNCPVFEEINPDQKELDRLAKGYLGNCDCKKRRVSIENHHGWGILVVEEEGLKDDSVKAIRVQVPLLLIRDRWVIGEKEEWSPNYGDAPTDGKTFKGRRVTRQCRPGRGHTVFTEEPCL